MIRPCGTCAFLVECDDVAQVLALHAAITAAALPGVIDVVPAARTVLVRAATPDDAARAREFASGAAGKPPGSPDDDRAGKQLNEGRSEHRDTLVQIEVCYDGADLAALAALTGLSEAGVVAAHTGQTWTAAFAGFAPGFVYCVGENDVLTVPRRATPRTSVPAGAVGLADEYSAVYPRATPGGWHLVGRTTAPIWDTTRATPALVAPGNRIRYVAVRECIEVPAPPPRQGTPATEGLLVDAPGVMALIQDDGRPGFAHLGVPESGALDRASAARANALVGNPSGAAVIETLLGGLRVTALGDQIVAVCGAAGRADPFRLHEGDSFTVPAPAAGLRTYLAVRGGVDVPRSLGSASTDLLSGEGPPPLAAGDVVGVGNAADSAPASPAAEPGPPPPPIRVTLGPRDDWFTPESVAAFLAHRWQVSHRSNRVGIRLEGEPLSRAFDGELTSEGMVAGAIQVPPDGLPVILLRDHPVTGGYPVVAVVDERGLDWLAQAAPGTAIRFALDEDG